MIKIFYAVFFVFLQGTPTVWDTSAETLYFQSPQKCLEYAASVASDLHYTIEDNQLATTEQPIVEAWCVGRLVKKETSL